MDDEGKAAQEPVAEDTRIDALEKRLAAAESREDVRKKPSHKPVDAGTRMGQRVLAELIGGMLGGAVIGWAIDKLADTSPWGLLVMLFMGTAVAFRNIIRMANARPDDATGQSEDRE